MSFAAEFSHVSVRFGDKLVLHDVSLSLPDRGVVALLGPGGSGKSTLLRLLDGTLLKSSTAHIRGSIKFVGQDITEQHRPALVPQRLAGQTATAFDWLVQRLPNRSDLTRLQQREFIESWLIAKDQVDLVDYLDRSLLDAGTSRFRRFAFAREILSNPALLCVDEITVGMEDADVERTVAWLKAEALQRAVLAVTHNQEQAKACADYAILLAAGQLVEYSPALQFFGAPADPMTAHYLRTGGCPILAPRDDSEGMEESTEPSEVDPVGLAESTSPYEEPTRPTPVVAGKRKSARGPEGFRWLKWGKLAGTPRPGIVAPLLYDIDALMGVGLTHLVTLTEQPLVGSDEFGQVGIHVEFFPIEDMQAPTLSDAAHMCALVSDWMQQGGCVAYHCKAGLGRTGTMLAAQLIYEGQDAQTALKEARQCEPRWVQSRTQEAFLSEFETFVANLGTKTPEQPASTQERKEIEYVP